MLQESLKEAIQKLSELIEMTKLDIESLSQAQNDQIFRRLPLKETLIREFEQKKAIIDSQMLQLKHKNPDQELSVLLGQEILDLLDILKTHLKQLKELNNGYARSVHAVGEFYTSLLRRIVPHENSGYGGYAKPQQNFLTIQV
ncbi:hypothetical protein [Helicobacter kayseriensis]|uniref:hypothetical protein n=1 Tax=Helicobacter kayseriensis TaxID=2905877 RepID=UPI001E32D509|nr:hypothetical protein [Helicobacter kayseriensis]MCE3046908.1 hypothetical protein [Helicobacter kayseriensis]MCE3048432.1 hypothetical protein [Helicobacter kayseriensis]